jgi:hypothetical protein
VATVHKAMLHATVLLLGGLVACGSGGTEGSPTGVSDEESIRDVVEQSFDALRTLDDERFQGYACEAKRQPVSSSRESSPFDEVFLGLRLQSVDDIRVDGAKASAQTRHYSVDEPDDILSDSIDLVREGGAWKVC